MALKFIYVSRKWWNLKWCECFRAKNLDKSRHRFWIILDQSLLGCSINIHVSFNNDRVRYERHCCAVICILQSVWQLAVMYLADQRDRRILEGQVRVSRWLRRQIEKWKQLNNCLSRESYLHVFMGKSMGWHCGTNQINCWIKVKRSRARTVICTQFCWRCREQHYFNFLILNYIHTHEKIYRNYSLRV